MATVYETVAARPLSQYAGVGWWSGPLIPKSCPQRLKFHSLCSHQSRASVSLTRSPAAQFPSAVTTPRRVGPCSHSHHHRLSRPGPMPQFTDIPSDLTKSLKRSRNSNLPELSPCPPPTPGTGSNTVGVDRRDPAPPPDPTLLRVPMPGTGTWAPSWRPAVAG